MEKPSRLIIISQHHKPAVVTTMLTMVEATMGWLETYRVTHAIARNTIFGLEKQVLFQHGTSGRIESDNGTHCQNNLINTWAKKHGID